MNTIKNYNIGFKGGKNNATKMLKELKIKDPYVGNANSTINKNPHIHNLLVGFNKDIPSDKDIKNLKDINKYIATLEQYIEKNPNNIEARALLARLKEMVK